MVLLRLRETLSALPQAKCSSNNKNTSQAHSGKSGSTHRIKVHGVLLHEHRRESLRKPRPRLCSVL